MQKSRKGFIHRNYHWVVAVVLGLMLFIHGGAQNNFQSLHLVPISEHLNISRGEFSLLFGIKGIVAMLITFFSGFIIAKFGTRIMATVGLLLAVSSYLVFANVQTVWMIVLGSVLMGLSYGFCTTSAAVALVRLWFHKYEGTVLGVVTAATGIGGSVISILQTAAMEAGSFRSSLTLCAAMLLVVAVLVLLLIRNRPEDMDLVPLGEGERLKKRPKAEQVSYMGLPMKQLWRQPAFYLMLLGTALSSFSLYMAFNVVRNFFVDCQFSAAQATGLYSAMMLLLAGTKLFCGVLCDKLGARKVNLICIAFGVLGLALLALTQNFAMAAVAVVIYTMSLPILTLMGPLVASNLFGYRAYTQYAGMLVSAVSLANLIGSYVTNLIYDIFGSYRPSFWLAAILSVVSGVLFLILYRMADKLKEKTEE